MQEGANGAGKVGKSWSSATLGDPAVIARAIHVSWYHFRAAFHRRWSGYLTVILLIGLVGGVAIGAVAAARRTQSTFPAYLAASACVGPPVPVL